MNFVMPSPAASARTLQDRKAFFYSLFICTIFPFFAIPLLDGRVGDASNWLFVLVTIEFLGSAAHVSAGYFFCFSPPMRPIFITHAWRMIWVPVGLAVVTALIFWRFPPAIGSAFLFAYFIWQTWHYQRQNIGVLGFVGVSTRTGGPSKFEKTLFYGACIAGILALTKHYNLGADAGFTPYQGSFYRLGIVLQGLVLLGLVVWLVRAIGNRVHWGRILTVVSGSIFFLPTFFFTSPVSAVLTYALGHGFQYLVFLYWVSTKKVGIKQGLLTLIALAAVLGPFLIYGERMRGTDIGNIIFGIKLAAVMTHFLHDSVIWRLRETVQRNYMLDVFSFLHPGAK